MKNIVLTGFMGTGKSSTGKLLAYRLGKSFVDIDKQIEKKMGMTIPDIFANLGEEFFRAKEHEIVAHVSRYKNAVIATGGGVVLNARNMECLRERGIIICLTASPEVILERTSRKPTRPLLQCENPRQVIVELLAKRQPFYDQADYQVDSSNLTPYQVTEQIITYLRRGGYLRAQRIR
jgi:shikimate kinase